MQQQTGHLKDNIYILHAQKDQGNVKKSGKQQFHPAGDAHPMKQSGY